MSAFLFVLSLAASVGADVTRFDLAGAVTDATGGVLPGVTVTLKNVDTGFVRSTVTDDQGRYSFTALNPTGKWTLSVELAGFAPQNREGLEFQANTRPEINFRLSVGSLQEAVTVEASSPLIRTRESELSAILDTRQVENLPTNGRNFLSLLQTSGSVVPTGATSSSGISVNGQGIRMANFVADGVSMTGREIRTVNGEFGGGNGLSIDAIKEVQVISNGFKAETGQTGAGTISVVTKSGTNTLSGSAYGFWRPTDLVAANLLTGQKTTQKRMQYGGTIGGPIKKDRTHYFANYEDTNIDDVVVVTSALAPGTFPAPQTQRQGFLKLNHRFDDHNALDARYSFNRNTQEGQSVGGLNTYDRRTNTEGRTDAFVASLVSNFGTNKVNEARFRYTFDVVDFYSPLTASSGGASRTPDFSNAPVTVTYTGVGNLGTNPSFPQNLVEKRAQWVDHFSVVRGSHQLKAGVDIIGSWRFVTFFNNFAGTYTFAQGAKYPFNANDPSTFPIQFTQTFGTSGLNFKDYMAGVFAQDDWEVARGLTVNVGVRWDKDSLFQGDNNNLAPRLGFAWNVAGSTETVVRGNVGIFYDTLESSLINRESNTGPVGQTTIDLRPGDPLFPSFPDRLSAFPSGANTVARATVYVPVFQGPDFPLGIGNDFQRIAPHFVNANLGVQHEIGSDWAVSADYARVYGYDLLVTWDTNAPPYFPLGPGQTRTLAQGNVLRPLGVPNATGGPYGIDFTGFRSLYLQFNGGHTEYNALKLAATKRLSHHYDLQASYTFGRARGDVDNFRLANSFVPGLTAIGGDRSYQWGPSDTDVPQVFVMSGMYEAPLGLRVGTILFARSGFPYTGVVGVDADGDGVVGTSSFSDRPASLTRNSFRYPATVTLDTSVAYDLRLGGSSRVELRLDVFNLLNRLNVATVNNIIGLNPLAPPSTFGTITGVRDQRQAQVAVRYRF
ncbi:MAG TPA: carboxypeptidase regulatory-like domain-containing protein [Vicinamibacterales bacterium]|nr:carboxypeptidase regulatory-like domain-containing protein [Vicinamibacterales bacterium]